jgi:lactoylglutathione lyase
MAQIRHIAFASHQPFKTAEFYKQAFGFKEINRFRFDPNNPDDAPLGAGVLLTDGHLNIAILKFAKDQTGVGLNYVGFHHFGVVVDDIDEWTTRLETLGAPNITRPEDMPPTAHFEIKFRAPENVVFDISHSTWPGAAPVDPETMKPPALAEAAE